MTISRKPLHQSKTTIIYILTSEGFLHDSIEIDFYYGINGANNIVLGYWGDIFLARMVGEFNEEFVTREIISENSKKKEIRDLVITQPEGYTIEKISNKWTNTKRQYFFDISNVGLIDSNKKEIIKFLESLTKVELRKFRNTLFAINGYIFKSEELVNYFNEFNWYISNKNISNSKEILTVAQKELFDLIWEYEKR